MHHDAVASGFLFSIAVDKVQVAVCFKRYFKFCFFFLINRFRQFFRDIPVIENREIDILYFFRSCFIGAQPDKRASASAAVTTASRTKQAECLVLTRGVIFMFLTAAVFLFLVYVRDLSTIRIMKKILQVWKILHIMRA